MASFHPYHSVVHVYGREGTIDLSSFQYRNESPMMHQHLIAITELIMSRKVTKEINDNAKLMLTYQLLCHVSCKTMQFRGF